jgi:hypothetical protein
LVFYSKNTIFAKTKPRIDYEQDFYCFDIHDGRLGESPSPSADEA